MAKLETLLQQNADKTDEAFTGLVEAQLRKQRQQRRILLAVAILAAGGLATGLILEIAKLPLV